MRGSVGSAFPAPPYTTLATTPVSREKPFLYLDSRGRYQVRVPDAKTNTSGISWAGGLTPGPSPGSLAARVALNHQHIQRETLARTLCVLPMHFGHGLIGNCLTPLFAAGHLFIARGDGLTRAARLSSSLVEHDITFMSSVEAYPTWGRKQ